MQGETSSCGWCGSLRAMVDLYTVMMSVMQMTRMKVDVEEEGDIKHVMVRYQYCCLGKEEGVCLKWA